MGVGGGGYPKALYRLTWVVGLGSIDANKPDSLNGSSGGTNVDGIAIDSTGHGVERRARRDSRFVHECGIAVGLGVAVRCGGRLLGVGATEVGYLGGTDHHYSQPKGESHQPGDGNANSWPHAAKGLVAFSRCFFLHGSIIPVQTPLCTWYYGGMRVSDYDYNLPEDRIATRPPAVRGTTRLLVLDKTAGSTEDRHYTDLIDYLGAGDVLVLNDTRVIPARLEVFTAAGAKREILVLEKHHDTNTHEMRVMYRGTLRAGDVLKVHDQTIAVTSVLEGGLAMVRSDSDLYQLATKYGQVPLPPYMHREADQSDAERYQTMFAQEQGSVAAPTASLNLTQQLLQQIKAKGVIIQYLTLHVGLGTFLPIRSDEVEGHTMHQEYFEIPVETVAAIRQARKTGKKVTAVGTTVTRTLEYAASQILSQDGPTQLAGEADIYIYPGYQFQIIDQLVTNFHAPRSTVLMLTAAFAGWDYLKPAYDQAIAGRYSMLSYGDSMLIH